MRRAWGLRGLGLGGALAINLCGALVLAGWLVFGDLALPARGRLFLWGLVGLLVVVSLAELGHLRGTGDEGAGVVPEGG